MNTIQRPDQHLASYIHLKQVNPDAKIVWRKYQKRLVDTIDRIVELAHGQRDEIKSEKDWKIVEELFSFFAKEWPNEYADFRNAIPKIREAKGTGYSKSREILHVGSIPPRFARMIRAIFPAQEWNKKFVSKFVKRFPLFKVGE